MSANFPNAYMGTTTPQITSEKSTDNLVINVTASTTMPTTFMNILGLEEK